MVETEQTRIIIDAGPDFRTQMLQQPFRKIDALLVTHSHYDHVGGMDDLRPYCQFGEINVYADPIATEGLRQMMPYCFADNRYPGVPAIQLHTISSGQRLTFGDIDVLPIRVMHGKLPILGFRIGDMAYITDIKTLPENQLPLLQGLRLLVLGALRYKPDHHSHQLVDDAIALSDRLGKPQTLLTHMCHDVGLHSKVNSMLPDNVRLAYDGQTVEL